jgi:hypothetical protein
MYKKEPKPMKEIHLIREKIYNETKGKSIYELMKYIKKTAKKFEKSLSKKQILTH